MRGALETMTWPAPLTVQGREQTAAFVHRPRQNHAARLDVNLGRVGHVVLTPRDAGACQTRLGIVRQARGQVKGHRAHVPGPQSRLLPAALSARRFLSVDLTIGSGGCP